MIRLHRDKIQNYYYLFDYATGAAVRWEKGDKDPFWRERGPEILDISITDYCERECEFCYRKASRQGYFMELPLYEQIIQQAEQAGVQQIALGGGNPNQHPKFVEFLKIAREHHIIASYTTNGQGMTDEIYRATKQYGGAVAISWYFPYNDAENVIKKCGEYGIPVNIHFLLHKKSVSDAMRLLQSEQLLWNYVNAIVFLNYKPIRTRTYEGLRDSEEMDLFLKTALTFEECKIGFDSCMISWLMKYRELIVGESIDFCEAGRFSAFISERGFMYPCSFLCEDVNFRENIREKSLTEIWKNGTAFIIMRGQLKDPVYQKMRIPQCMDCGDYPLCHGGCPVFSINRCQ